MASYKTQSTTSSRLRDTLDFPVIDTDGHVIEAEFVLPDFLKQVGGPEIVKRYHNMTAAACGAATTGATSNSSRGFALLGTRP